MQHLKIMKIVDIVFGALFIGGGLFGGVMMLLPVIAAIAEGEMAAMAISIVFALLFLLGFGIIGALFILVGMKVGRGRWRIPQTIVALLQVTNFPIGTAFALYCFWALWMNEESRNICDAGGVENV